MAFGNTAKDGSGDDYWTLVDAGGRQIITELWQADLQSDVALNDSDKTFTVPADTEWIIQSIWIEFATTADAGNRQLVVEIQDDAADVIAQTRTGLVQAASATYYYLLAPDVTELTAVRDSDYISTIMPAWLLPASYVVRIYDNNAVQVAADDMILHMMVKSRNVA